MRKGFSYKLLPPYRITRNSSKTLDAERDSIPPESLAVDESSENLTSTKKSFDAESTQPTVQMADFFVDSKSTRISYDADRLSQQHLQAGDYHGDSVSTKRSFESREASPTPGPVQRPDDDDRNWLLPELELPSRAITFDRRSYGPYSPI